jgi:peptidoglycan/LPS O-acetylase OafA/YrhL
LPSSIATPNFYPLVDFFFVLSGFVIMHIYGRGEGIRSISAFVGYLRKRFARIYPLFALTLAIYVILAFLAARGLIPGGAKPWFRSDTFFANLFLVHAWGTVGIESFNYPSWSVSAEVFVYLLFPILFLIVRRLGWAGGFAVAALSMAGLSVAFATYSNIPWWRATTEFGCLRAVPSFLAGMAVYPLATVRFADLKVPLWVAHSAPCAAVALMVSDAAPELVICTHVAAVFLLARADLSNAPGVFSRPFPRLLANASYGVYMLHVLVGRVTLEYLPRSLHISTAWQPALVVAALVITATAAALCYLWFEEPARRYLTKPRSRVAAELAPAKTAAHA